MKIAIEVTEKAGDMATIWFKSSENHYIGLQSGASGVWPDFVVCFVDKSDKRAVSIDVDWLYWGPIKILMRASSLLVKEAGGMQ